MAERKLKLILNPISKPLKILMFLKPAIDILEKGGYKVDTQESACFGDAEAEARKAAGSGEYDLIVAAGGDGTFNQVINGIHGKDIPLGLIALGTSNVLARSLELPLNPVDAAKIIVEGNLKKWDLGVVNGRYFAIMCGFGFDAVATEETNLKLKRFLGRYAYILAGIQCLSGYKPTRMTVALDGKPTPYRPIFVDVANAPFYGGKYKLTPDAKMDDGILDVFIFDSPSLARFIYLLLRVTLNLPPDLPEISITIARTLDVTSPGWVPYQLYRDSYR